MSVSVLQTGTIRGQQKASPHRANGRGHGTEGMTSMQEKRTGLCECGCGRPTKLANRSRPERGQVKGQPLRVIIGHSGRAVGGRKIWYRTSRSGRWVVVGRNGKNYLWYRILMENEIGRPLQSNETVHHINEDCGDDRIENLMILSRQEHSRLHAIARETWRNLPHDKHPDRFCEVAGCDRKYLAKGMCRLHYNRQWDAAKKAEWAGLFDER